MRTCAWAAFLAIVFSGCGGGVTETGNPNVYVSTNSSGDLGIWSVQANASFTLAWSVAAPTTGAVQYVSNLGGTCGSTSNFGFRTCTLTSASCQAQGAACPSSVPAAGDPYLILEVPGVLLLGYAEAQSQLHVGILQGNCGEDISGDYAFLNAGLGLPEVFGAYRVSPGISNIVKAGFKFTTPSAPTLFYDTTDDGGAGNLPLTSSSCANGVITLDFDGFLTRATITQSGLGIFAFPFPFGGAFGFRTGLAVSTAELADLSFFGFVFPEGAAPTTASLVLGPLAGAQVAISSLTYQTGAAPAVSGHALESAKDIGSAYGFNGVPPGASPTTYATNVLSATYLAPADIPGVFVDSAGSSAANFTIYTAMRSAAGGQILLFGTTVDLSSGVIKTVGTAAFIQR